MYMTLFCFLASLTSLSLAIWVTKCFFFLSESNHNAWSWNQLGFENIIGWCVFVAASAEILFPLECIAACPHGWPRPGTQAPLRISGSALWDLCCWCVLALYPKCLPTKQTSARARFQTTDPSFLQNCFSLFLRFCESSLESNLCLHLWKTPFRDSSSPFHFILPENSESGYSKEVEV